MMHSLFTVSLIAAIVSSPAHALEKGRHTHLRDQTTRDQIQRALQKGGGGGGGGGGDPTCSTERAKECEHCNGPNASCRGGSAEDVCCAGYACTNGLYDYGTCALITPAPTPKPTASPTTGAPTTAQYLADLNVCCNNWCNSDDLWGGLTGAQTDTNGMGSNDGCPDENPCDCTSSNWNTLSYTINQHSSSGYNKCNAFNFNSDPNNGYAAFCDPCPLDGSHCALIDVSVRGEIDTMTGFCDCIATVTNNNEPGPLVFDVVVWSDDCTETNYDSRYDESCGGEPRFQADYVPNTCLL